MCTVGSEKFGRSDQFTVEKPEPSVLIKNDLLIINQASFLFKSVSELKDSFNGIEDQAHLLTASVCELQTSVDEIVCESENATAHLK